MKKDTAVNQITIQLRPEMVATIQDLLEAFAKEGADLPRSRLARVALERGLASIVADRATIAKGKAAK